jgi:hypothetical protein
VFAAATFLVLFGGGLLTLGIVGRGTVLGRSFAQLWWQPPAMFGLMLAGGGVARRAGDTLHCPRCEYEFRFPNPDDAPIRCPECGSAWLGLLRKGKRVRSPRLIAAGLATAALFFVVLQPVFYMRWLAPHLPTPLLFASLYASPKTWYSAWDELASRPLDAWSIRTMAERVLVVRRADQYDSAPAKWFEAMTTAGKIPPELLERYYREGVDAELVVPAHVKAGERFRAKLRVRTVAGTSGSQQIGLFFGGYRVNEGPARGKRAETLWAFSLRPDVFSTSKDSVPTELQAPASGSARVTVEYWVVYLPSFGETLSWRADGTPARPAQAAWFQRIELEKTVRVE